MSADLWTNIVALLADRLHRSCAAGDNAIVVGLAVAGLAPGTIGARPSCWGLGGAVILRILFSIVALSLLEIHGLA